MTEENGFLTLVSINKGLSHRYNQLKLIWIITAAFFGISAGLWSWFYCSELIIPVSVTGTFIGAALFFLLLKCIPETTKEKRD